MKLIPLSGKYGYGKFAKVDDEDFERINQYKWHVSKGKGTTRYAVARVIGVKNKIIMHRLIMETPDGFITDHKNHDGLDNRRVNLRTCTIAENNANKRPVLDKTSKYLGVHWEKQQKKYFKKKTGEFHIYKYGYWTANLEKNNKRLFLGYFKTEIEAALAYNEAAKKYHGEFANLNIING